MKKTMVIVFLIVGVLAGKSQVYSMDAFVGGLPPGQSVLDAIPEELQFYCLDLLFGRAGSLDALKKEFGKTLLICRKWNKYLVDRFGASKQKGGAKVLSVKSLLSFFSVLKWHRNQGWKFPLHNALVRNLPRCDDMLESAPKEELEVRDLLGNFPLHYACHHGSEEQVKKILQKQRSPNGCNKLYEAVRSKNSDLVGKLLADGVNPNGAGNVLGITPLGAARLRPDKLQRSGEDTRIIQLLKKSKLEALTPLQEAAKIGAPDLVAMLLEAGAYVDGIDERGRTALFYVLENGPEGAKDTIQKLVSCGASVIRRDTWKRSPMAVAQQELKLPFQTIVRKTLGVTLDIIEEDDVIPLAVQLNGLTL